MPEITQDSIIITTQSGNDFKVYRNGFIQRLDMEGFKPSNTWTLLRLVTWKGRKVFSLPEIFDMAQANRFVEFNHHKKLVPNRGEIEGENPEGIYVLRFKNRSPKLHVMDNDHGTKRQWSDGITNIRYTSG